jgi:hypothetical protein
VYSHWQNKRWGGRSSRKFREAPVSFSNNVSSWIKEEESGGRKERGERRRIGE